MTTRKTTDPHDKLISLGLLPNPNQQTSWTPTIAPHSEHNPLLDLYEQNARTLAERLLTARADRRRSDQMCIIQTRLAIRRAEALEWLRTEYDLDDLALEVIAHVLVDPTIKAAD